MDQLDHDIVQDLLPLYHDGVCSDKSRAAVGAVGLLLWSRRYTAVFVCPSCGAELSGQDFRSSKWSPDGSKIMYCHICGAMFPVEECRRKEP